MLGYLTLIFCCQLFGELLATATGLPVPGPVCGMLILLAGLMVYGSVPTDLAGVTSGLLDNLSLLFIPAGVGVMLHANLLARDWLPLTVALFVSTGLTIVVTAMTMNWLSRAPATPERTAGDE